MRFSAVITLLLLTGCGSWYPVAMLDHTSNPVDGEPFNTECDATADFIGGGAGHEFANKNTRMYMALGVKRIRQCSIRGAPAIDKESLGAKALLIHEFRGEKN